MPPNGEKGCIQRWPCWHWIDRSAMPVVVSPPIEHHQVNNRLCRVGFPQKVVWRKCAVILLGINDKISRVRTVNTKVDMAVHCCQQSVLKDKENPGISRQTYTALYKNRMSLNPFSPETLQPVQPEGFQPWRWKCWLHYSKCSISATSAPRTLKFGTIITATWIFYNIFEIQCQ